MVHNKELWNHLSYEFEQNQLNVSKSRNTKEGIKTFPVTVDDYRNITKYLDANNVQYHTFGLPEDKLLHVVFRNIPVEIDTKIIKNDLINKGFHPENVFRMKNKAKNPIPLVLVKLPKNEKFIIQLTDVSRLITKVETLINKTGTGQCFRC